jgi:soluble lytic murein transglycosylase-like protein
MKEAGNALARFKGIVFCLFVASVFMVAMLLPDGNKPVAITGKMEPLTPEIEKKFEVFRQFESKRKQARSFAFDLAQSMVNTIKSAGQALEVAFSNPDSDYWEKKAEARKMNKIWDKVVEQWGDHIKTESKLYGVDWRHTVALICKESEGNPNAINKQDGGAFGLMQLRMSTAQWLQPGVTKEDLFDPELNIHLGVKRLAKAKELMSSEAEAILAYHFGETGARREMAQKGKSAEESDDWLFVNAIIKVAS